MKINLSILVTVICTASCIPINYDSQIFREVSGNKDKFNDILLGLSLESSKNSPLNNNIKSPWFISLSAKSKIDHKITIEEVKLFSNEGGKIVYSGARLLPLTQYQGNGSWDGQLTSDQDQILIDPLYYKNQKLKIIIKINIDDNHTINYVKRFEPFHMKGRETVNLLTM